MTQDKPDGKVLGYLTIPATGDNLTFTDVTCSFDKISGVKNIFDTENVLSFFYLLFPQGSLGECPSETFFLERAARVLPFSGFAALLLFSLVEGAVCSVIVNLV